MHEHDDEIAELLLFGARGAIVVTRCRRCGRTRETRETL